MKKQFAVWTLMCVYLLMGVMPALAETDDKGRTRDISVEGQLDGVDDEGIVRSIRMPTITASITDGQLTINFQTKVREAEVTVTNLTTGEVVYLGTYAEPGTVSFWVGEEPGEYLLEMTMPYWYFSGDFSQE